MKTRSEVVKVSQKTIEQDLDDSTSSLEKIIAAGYENESGAYSLKCYIKSLKRLKAKQSG